MSVVVEIDLGIPVGESADRPDVQVDGHADNVSLSYAVCATRCVGCNLNEVLLAEAIIKAQWRVPSALRLLSVSHYRLSEPCHAAAY